MGVWITTYSFQSLSNLYLISETYANRFLRVCQDGDGAFLKMPRPEASIQLLRRLMKEEYVSSSWQESAEGLPPRKYYSITYKGLEYISAMSKEWNNLLNQSMKSKENKSMEKLASLFGLIVIPVFAICSPVFIICAIEDVYGKTGSRRYLSGDN